MTPAQYDELAWSFEYDPPVDDLLRDLLLRMAQLISAFYNANSGKDANTTATDDFLTKWGEELPDDGEHAPELLDEGAAARAAKDELRAGLRVQPDAPTAPLMRNPKAKPVPAHLFRALTGEDQRT